MKIRSILVGACLFFAVSVVGNMVLPDRSFLSSQAWAQAQQLELPDLSQPQSGTPGPQDQGAVDSTPAKEEPPATWKDVIHLFFIDLWASIIDQWPLIYKSLQISVLILALFGYTVYHVLHQKRLARERALYGDDESRCSCGLPHGQCDWCKEDRA